MTKRLTKSSTNRMIFGVLGGVAEYFETDATLVRLIYLLITVASGIVPGLLIYLIAAVIVPDAATPSVQVNDTPEV